MSAYAGTYVFSTFNFDLGSFGGVSTNWSNVQVAYLTKQSTGANAWTSVPLAGQM